MTGYPLLYLTLTSTRNLIRVRLRRLRQPRYLIATLLGLGYFGFILWGQGGRGGRTPMSGAIEQGRAGVQLVATLLLFAGAALAWIWPRSGKPALPFSLADVQHLFTAPIPRRHLVRYRVLRSQISAVVVGTIITVLFRPAGVSEGITMFLGLALVLATTNVHLTGVSLSRSSAGPRRWVPTAVAVAAVVVIATTVAGNWAALRAIAAQGGSVSAEIDRLSTDGLAGAVLWPFRMLAGVALSESARAFLTALPWAVALLILNYVWVLRTDAPFEEASAELSVKLAALRQGGVRAARPPRASKRTPFTLAPHGRLETAILWKNLISMGRVLSWTLLVRIAPLIVLLAVALSRGGNETTNLLTVACLFVAGFATLLGPQIARSDLRQDLAVLEVLKTWPIRGGILVRGEILAPAIVLISAVWLALIAAAVLSTQAPFAAQLPNRWSWLVGALFMAPGLVLVQLVAQNALAVTFPSWIAIGKRPGGVEAIGQGAIVIIVILLAMVAALLPAAIVAGVVSGILYLLVGTVPIAIPAALAGGVLLVEAFAGSEIVGAILERSDISALDPSERA